MYSFSIILNVLPCINLLPCAKIIAFVVKRNYFAVILFFMVHFLICIVF